jgi:hypothetical protein
LTKLYEKMTQVNDEFDAMINLAGVGNQINCSISDSDIFEEYERLQTLSMNTNILMTHAASRLLSPNGFCAFPGDINIFKRSSPEEKEQTFTKVDPLLHI